MALELGMVTVDCADPRRLADFWTKAIGVEVEVDYDGYLILAPMKEGGTKLAFQRVPEELSGKNRLHLDFATEDRSGEVARLVSLGASELDTHEMPGLSWTVLADPEGNVFCVGGGDH